MMFISTNPYPHASIKADTMPHDQTYLQAENKIEQARRSANQLERQEFLWVHERFAAEY